MQYLRKSLLLLSIVSNTSAHEKAAKTTDHDDDFKGIIREGKKKIRGGVKLGEEDRRMLEIKFQGNKKIRRLNNNSKKIEGDDITGDVITTPPKSDGDTSLNLLNAYYNPIAVEDKYTLLQNTAIKEGAPGILFNDVNSGTGVLTIINNSLPKNGNITLWENGGFSYKPLVSFHGRDFFDYTISNGGGGMSFAKVHFEVIPLAIAHKYLTTLNTRVTKDCVDLVADHVQITKYTKPKNGALTTLSDGGFSYVPHDDFAGQDSFIYTASDGRGGSGKATITIVVEETNKQPVAGNDKFSTPQKSVITIEANDILANDTDEDGDTLSIVEYSTPSHGSLINMFDGGFTYAPEVDFVGTETIQYTIHDGTAANNARAEGIIEILVTKSNETPVAKEDSFKTSEGTSLTIQANKLLSNDYDLDGDVLEIMNYGDPKKGTVMHNEDGGFTYMPNDGFVGEDTFGYTVSDGQGGKHSGLITITVERVNRAPKGTDDIFKTTKNTELIISKDILLQNDSDSDGNPLSIVACTEPIYGFMKENESGNIIYRPNTDFVGKDTFEYTISDGAGGSGSAIVTITVEDVELVGEGVGNAEGYANEDLMDDEEVSSTVFGAILRILRVLFPFIN